MKIHYIIISLILFCSSVFAETTKEIKVNNLIGGLQLTSDGSKLLYTTFDESLNKITANVINTSDLSQAVTLENVNGPVSMDGSARYITYRQVGTTDSVTLYDSSSVTTSILANTNSPSSNFASLASSGPFIDTSGLALLYFTNPTGQSSVTLKKYLISSLVESDLSTFTSSWLSGEVDRSAEKALTRTFTGGNATCLQGSIEECTSIGTTGSNNLFCSRPPKSFNSDCGDTSSWVFGGSSTSEMSSHSMNLTRVKRRILVNGKLKRALVGVKLSSSAKPESFYFIPKNLAYAIAPFGSGVSGSAMSSDGKFAVFIVNKGSLQRRVTTDAVNPSKNFTVYLFNLETGRVVKRFPASKLNNKADEQFKTFAPSFKEILEDRTVVAAPVISGNASTIAFPVRKNDEYSIKIISGLN